MNKLETSSSPAVRTSMRTALNARAVRVLHEADQMWKSESEKISGAAQLTETQRASLRPIMRHWCVRYTPMQMSRLPYVEMAITLLAAGACLTVPLVVVGRPALRVDDRADLVCASFGYLVIFGALSSCYFELARQRTLAILGLVGAAVSLVGGSIATVWVHNLGKTIELAFIAGALAAAIIALGSFTATVFARYLWYPLRRRHVATVPPYCAAAAWLWNLSRHVEDGAKGWRSTSAKRVLLDWVTYTSYWLDFALPQAMWMSGCRGPGYTEAKSHYHQAASFVKQQAWRIVDANDITSFLSIRDDLAEGAVALARGDWTWLPQAEELSRTSWVLNTARRLITPVLLLSMALALPHLPDVKLNGSALTSLQAALLLAGILSLTPLGISQQGRDLFSESRPGS
jgi:hypothetical protein